MPDYEADEALDEMFEADEADEADEAATPWRRRPPRPSVASGRGLYRPRPTTQYVTQTQLEAALAKVGGQIRTNSSAISTLNNRVAGASAVAKKEAADRKKDTTALKNNLSQTQQMAAIMPLLTQPQHITVSETIDDDNGNAQIPTGTELLVNGNNTTSLLLPLLLMTSVGGDSSSGGGGLFGGGGGDNSTLLMLALVLGLGNK
jgi:hypothetical protein